MAGRKVGLPRHAGKLVPRAHQLAIVTAVNAVAHGRAEFLRDGALQLDREVRDAAARIQLVGRHDRSRGAHVDTGAAASAVVGGRLVDGQGQICVQLAEEEPGAGALVQQVGVLADPAQARIARQRLLQNRRAVDEDPVA